MTKYSIAKLRYRSSRRYMKEIMWQDQLCPALPEILQDHFSNPFPEVDRKIIFPYYTSTLNIR